MKKITGDEPANILTIRQEFAKAAMSAILNAFDNQLDTERRERITSWINTHGKGLNISQYIAKDAVLIADALMTELNREK